MKTLLYKDNIGLNREAIRREGLTEEGIFKELLKTEKDSKGLDGGDLEEKIDNKDSFMLFTLDEDKEICGHVIYEVKQKYIQINHIIARSKNYKTTIFNLINSIRCRKSYSEKKWIRIWVLQDFEHLELCKILTEYGFKSFYDKDNPDMTRFALKEKK